MGYFSELHMVAKEDGLRAARDQVTRDCIRGGRTPQEAEQYAEQMYPMKRVLADEQERKRLQAARYF